jgi:hypothetical protein
MHAITEGDRKSLEDRFHLHVREKGIGGDTRRRVSMKKAKQKLCW